MPKSIAVIAFLVAAFFLPGISAEEEKAAWIKSFEKDGITVYKRDVPESSVKEIKAQARIDASAERIWKVIGDFDNYKDFMPYTKESEITHEEDDTFYFYTYLQIGWGIGDRFYTIRITKERNAGNEGAYKKNWDLADKDTKTPHRPGAIEVPVNKGYWLLTPRGADSTDVVYYLYTDPGGGIPKIIVNFANAEAVPEIIRAVEKRLDDERYD